jgi:hypothetical protein
MNLLIIFHIILHDSESVGQKDSEGVGQEDSKGVEQEEDKDSNGVGAGAARGLGGCEAGAP